MTPHWFSNGAFPLYLAPMAGVTDPVFRTLCKELGADVTVSEFVSAEGVLQAWERNRRYAEFEETHRPAGVQIFGSNPTTLSEAARRIADELHPDFIDLNAGCPVPKVVGHNGGSSLLKDLPLLEKAAQSLVNAVGEYMPVTAKIRIGWDADHICALDACRRLENVGISAIAIHGRTRSQQYSGHADWTVIGECASACHIPIIGNGDISSPEDVLRIRKETSVRGVMIGRSAMVDPWIFARTKAYFKTGEIPSPPTPTERASFMLRQATLEVSSARHGGELTSLRALRSRLLAQAKQLPGSKAVRPLLSKVSSLDELRTILLPWLSA